MTDQRCETCRWFTPKPSSWEFHGKCVYGKPIPFWAEQQGVFGVVTVDLNEGKMCRTWEPKPCHGDVLKELAEGGNEK